MWARINPRLYSCPQIFEAGSLLGRDGYLTALGGLTKLVLWSRQYGTDGVITAAVMSSLVSRRVVKALIHGGLLKPRRDGWILQQEEWDEFWLLKSIDSETSASRRSIRRQMKPRLRFRVFERDGFACQYCGRKAPDVRLEVDHRKPVAAGGTNDLTNLVTACEECNGGKSARVLQPAAVVPFATLKRPER
jgi:hypothetical protein